MRVRIAILAGLVCLAVAYLWVRQHPDRKADEKYIVESERQWAVASTNGDFSVVQRILADDFLGIAVDGSFYDKAGQIADMRDPSKALLSNHVNNIKVRFFGDTAVAQGDETWEQRSGTLKHGRYVWSDTWVRRGGRWQIVASQDLIAP